jgi:hypothetical protein
VKRVAGSSLQVALELILDRSGDLIIATSCETGSINGSEEALQSPFRAATPRMLRLRP